MGAKDVFTTRVAGISFRQDNLTGIRRGDICTVVPEPTNKHDPNALAVMRTDPYLQIGYIPRDCATAVGAALDAGCILTAVVDSVGPAGDNIGVILRLEVEYPIA